MLSRRYLRIKVMQALYAFFTSDSDNLDYSEKQLMLSLEKLYDLYIYNLSLLIEVRDFASIKQEGAKNKFFPTEDEKNPNTKFVDNIFLERLNNNSEYLKAADKRKVNWSDEQDMIKKIYNRFKETKDYLEYMSTEDRSFNADKEICIKLQKKAILKHAPLHDYFEEKSIFWADDFTTSSMMVIKTIQGFDESMNEYSSLPSLFKAPDKKGQNEDKQFLIELFRKTILKSETFQTLIAEKAKNWELDRIALMDMILIKMALTEFIEFKTIPTKVTMNEYIEISKMYSTPKSKVFINGILDKLLNSLQAENKIKKTGRGLIN